MSSAEKARALAKQKLNVVDDTATDRESRASLRVIDSPTTDAAREEPYGRPFLEFVGNVEPDDNPADVFEADGLIVRGEPSLVIGDPKVGKTMTVEDLVLHIAAGRKAWCGVPIYRQCRVLLFLREDSKRTSVRRLWQLARGAGIRHDELDGFLTIDSDSPLYFDNPKLTAKLERQLGDHDICLIDSLSTIHNSDENSVERMAPVMNRWRDMALQTKTALPLVHHFRKRGESSVGTGGNVLQRARGSSLIAATTRHAVGIERGPNDHEIVLSVESNHEVSTEPFVVRRRFGVDSYGRKFITHERVGTMREALEADAISKIDPVVLAVIKGASVDGIGARDLRAAVIDRLRERDGKGVRPDRVDAGARRLEAGGKIGRTALEKWQIRACPEGVSK